MRSSLLWIVVAVIILVGPARLLVRLPSMAGRTASESMPAAAETDLGRAILPAGAEHPGLSGIRPLWEGTSAFAARMVLARAAQQSIDARYYIWQRDVTGYLLLAELKAAAERGVRVRLLVDDNGTGDLDPELAMLNALPNFEVRVFNPFSPRWPRFLSYILDFQRINRRMHNKSFSVDGVATVVGGRNIGDIYFARDAETQYSDFDILATGAVVGAVAADFDAYWNSDSSYPHELLVTPDAGTADAFDATLHEMTAQPDTEAYNVAVASSGLIRDLVAGNLALEWVPVRLLSDDPAKGLGRQPAGTLLTSALIPLLGEARTSIDVISAYFVPGLQGTERLAYAALQGARVRILTNGLEATDVLPVLAAYDKYREPLIASGVEIFELKRNAVTEGDGNRLGLLGSSGASLHAKVFVVDRSALFVGSFNFDPRSIWLNCEMGFWIESPTLATAVSEALDSATGDLTWQVGLQDNRLVWAGSDGVFHAQEPGSTAFKRLVINVLSRLPIEWMM